MRTNRTYTNLQLTALVLLRISIGWLFLYEGLCKLGDPYWTSAGYLLESKWLFGSFFRSLAQSPNTLAAVDFLNIWGLILIGTGLIAGFLTRYACYAGMVLLLLYYVTNPPLIGLEHSLPGEGNYLLINKNLIMAAALLVLAFFPTGHILGLDRLMIRLRR